MYIHNFDPIFINFGFFEIKWYSLSYIFGILIGWWLGKKILILKINNNSKHIDESNFDDLISYIIVSIILGGRIGYIIFYNLNYYLLNPIEIFKIWQGGMSFHGALLGVILATYIFAKRRSAEPLFYLDIVAAVAPIGIFFGRIANFINAELYGNPTNVFWSVIFPTIDEIPRHPSQIYEALLEGVLLFVINIFIILNKKIKTGVCASVFLILYGIFRIVGEQFRAPDIQVGYIFGVISMGSILSFTMIVSGIFLLIKVNK
tara:strand:- start:863 stop:1645 length:783 start_codon:yes stop_codon:yes gene_type:complete